MPDVASKRWISLDVFRGIAIAGMVLVNNPGSWEHVYPPLLHAKWHGCTPTDLIFPFFLFIVGTSMAFSLPKYLGGPSRRKLYGRILRRSAVLFLLGLALNSSSLILDQLFNGVPVDWGKLRIMGVLQRIGLAYLAAGLLAAEGSAGRQAASCAAVLLGYWVLMEWLPVPGHGAGVLTPEGNFAAYMDRLVLTPGHMYLGGPYDPEGLLSTMPAVATVLSGYWAGMWLQRRPCTGRTTLRLMLTGGLAVAAGAAWGLVFPLNKPLWTSSYVVFTSGFALVVLGLCYEIIEVRKRGRWTVPLQAMGMNAVFLFVASGLVARVLYRAHVAVGGGSMSAYAWLYERFFLPWASPVNGSLAFALATVVAWGLVLYGFYMKRWFFKV